MAQAKMCDFCTEFPPTSYYPARTFLEHVSNVEMIDEWYACDKCAKFIDEEDMKGLVEFVLESHRRRFPHLELERTPAQMKDHLYQIYVEFFKHRVGRRVPWQTK